jgi:chromate transport protein ChrA
MSHTYKQFAWAMFALVLVVASAGTLAAGIAGMVFLGRELIEPPLVIMTVVSALVAFISADIAVRRFAAALKATS